MNRMLLARAAWCILVCFLCIGCGGKGPQRPTYKSGRVAEEDSVAMALMTFNQRMAAEADRALLRYIESSKESYAQYEISNAWVRYVVRGTEGSSPRQDEVWVMRLRTKTLDGRLLIDEQRGYRIGRRELPICIELIMNELHHGDRLEVVSPWYSAYGMHGNSHVPPYTNVIIELDIE